MRVDPRLAPTSPGNFCTKERLPTTTLSTSGRSTRDTSVTSRLRVTRTPLTNEAWGFEPLETGAFEYADALGKFLPDADRPNEGVFALQDDDEQWMALRYDLTAPLARFAAQNWETLPKPFRRYAFGPVWRNEKPGPGRFRQFMQFDADTVGSARPEADAEIIAMAVEGLEAAGLPPDIPKVITEYGYSAFAGLPEVELPGAIINAETVGLLHGDPGAIEADDVLLDPDWLGDDYAVPTDAADAAIDKRREIGARSAKNVEQSRNRLGLGGHGWFLLRHTP